MQVCIVTGGNSGVGLMTSVGLAKLGYHVFIACRSQTKAAKAISYIRETTANSHIEYLPLNLASLDSVRHCAQLFLAKNLPLHILVNNAGIFNGSGVTEEGFELIWGTNYLGHFLLTYLLWDRLQASAPSRVVMVSSDMAFKPREVQWDLFVKPTPLNFIPLYNQSKLCLLLLTKQLAENSPAKFPHVTVNAVHPGFVQSNITIGHRLSKYLGLGISPEKGASSSLICATSPECELITGKFFDPQGEEMSWPILAQNSQLCQDLWDKSLSWTGGKEPVEKKPINYDGSDEVWGPYALNLTQDEMATIRQHLFQQVLPNPPVKVLVTQGLNSLVNLQFGSIMLLLVQCYQRQFYMERHLDSPVLFRLCQDENLLGILRSYLGDSFNLWRSELWVNYPSRQLIPFWHRDIYPNLLAGEGKTINIYIALTEVTERNGFEYVPKREADNCEIQVTDPFSGNHFFRVPKSVQEKVMPVVLRPGEFIVFTDRVIHRSVYNTSGKVRLSLTLRVAQDTVKILPGYSPIYHQPIPLSPRSAKQN